VIKTFILTDDKNRNLYGYFRTLSDAKESAQKGDYILTLYGPYFGEGWHRVIRRVEKNNQTKKVDRFN
jgi:hypothetical protein